MVRSFQLLFISFMFPLLLFGQDEGKPVKDTTEKKDPSSYKNEVGVGVHALGVLPLLENDPLGFNLLFQGSYKRKLEHFTLRVGIGRGKEYIYPNRHRENSGWIGRSTMILNLGLEKAIWRVSDLFGKRFEMDVALDLVHMNSWDRLEMDRFRATGMGLTLGNTFMLNRRSSPSRSHSSLSIEIGLAYGKSRSSGWGPFGIINGSYRNLVLSYNYHF